MAMINRPIVLAIVALCGTVAHAHDDGTPIAGQLVLVTSLGVTLDDVRSAHPALTLNSLRQFTPGRIHLLAIPPGQEETYETELAADVLLVRVAEQNRTVASPEHGTTQSLFLRTTAAGYLDQPAYRNINPPPATSRRGLSGTLVAVLDTGVAPHPDLVGRIEAGGYNFINDSPVVDESECEFGTTMLGHGTYVAGLITLTDPHARILPIVVLGCGGVGDSFAVACGIYHAIDMGAGVINMSFATTFASNMVEVAVQDASAAGVICVSSVSNGALDLEHTRVYPSRFEQVIAVGGVTRELPTGAWTKANFSDFGRDIDITAPAVDITSMWYDGVSYGYAKGSGTSYAAALVSGAVSMMRAKFGPHTPAWVEIHLCDTAQTVVIEPAFGLGCGHRNDGRAAVLDVGKAVCLADFNADSSVDFFDYDDFVTCFEGVACPTGTTADFDGDGSADFFDFDAFVRAFETGC